MMRPNLRWLRPLACVFALVASCSTTNTKLETSWRSPEATTLRFDKVVALAVTPDAATSRRIEDELAQRVPGAVAGYSVVPDEAREDDAELARFIEASGADGMLVVRMIGQDERTRWVPGSFPNYYYSPYGYHRYRGPYYNDPGYMRVEEVFRFETNVYDLEPETLLWSGLTSTVSPSSMESLIGELMDVIGDELHSQGLIAPAAE